MSQSTQFQPGDKVSLIAYSWSPALYPDCVINEEASDGWVVVSLHYNSFKLHQSTYGSTEFYVEKLEKNELGADIVRGRFVSEHKMVLVQKGNGFYTLGVDRPKASYEVFGEELLAFRRKVVIAVENKMAARYQGFKNPATFLADLYLNNSHQFMNSVLPTLWRKDGSVNPLKLMKAFKTLGLVIDEWATAVPIEVPEKFKRASFAAEIAPLKVDWLELTFGFHRSRVQETA